MTDPGNDARPAVLGMWDAVSIIIGIVVGTSIFMAPPDVAQNVHSPGQALLLWGLGGALSLVGAFCFAELVTAYPRSGGSYVYLTRAWGRCVGFQYGWGNLVGILAGNLGVMAFVFAEYAVRLFAKDAATPRSDHQEAALAIGAICVLTALNVVGVYVGKVTQNLLTGAKVVGLLSIVAAGLALGESASSAVVAPMTGFGGPSVAMIFVLYAYGGWSDTAFVAAEVRDPRRNLPRALILGISGIAAIYLLVNLGYLRSLGFEGLRHSSAPAADVLDRWMGRGGQRAMSAIVIASALGAVNGLIFTGSRVNAILGSDHPVFSLLSRWDPRTGTPALALIVQALVAVAMIAVVGTPEGRDGIDRLLAAIQLAPIPWKQYHGGFGTLLAGTAPLYWLFFLLTGVSLFVLRYRDPGIERPFRVPFYPVTPIIFCLTCAWMLWSSLEYARWLSLIGLGPLALGLPAYVLSEWRRSRSS